jgi:tetratricopeptide (TPR) repeat protein
MSYYTQKQWARAEEYLRRCLIKKPRQPAVWNNLGMICMYTERYEEGLGYAKRALSIIPESAEVKDTIKQIEEAWKKAREESGEEAKKPATEKKPDSAKNPEPVKKSEPAKKADSAKKPEPAKKADAAKPNAAKKPAPAKKPEPAKKQEHESEVLTTNALDSVKTAMASPRDEMEKAVLRADFEAAAPHAELVLAIDPGDPVANFAVGMYHFGKRQWAKAAEKLKRSLERNPTDPVTLNNLAITCLYQQRYVDALKYAEKALDLLPGSAEIEETLSQIKKLKEAADKAKAAKQAKKKPAAQKPVPKKPAAGAKPAANKKEPEGTVQ